MIKNSRILITGATGFIGRHLVESLLSKNNHITGTYINNEDTSFLNLAIKCDISNFNQIKSLANFDFDHVFHLAAIADVNASIANPALDFSVNARGTFNMLEIFKNKRIKSFNFISTVSVLSSDNTLPLGEESFYGPTTPYSASKMSSEGFCTAFSNCYGIPVKIIRLFNVFGPFRKGLVVYDFISSLIKNPQELLIRGDGQQIRDFLFVDDAIDGIEIIAEKGLINNIYHLGSGIPTSILNLAEEIISIMHLDSTNIITTNENYSGEFLVWYANIKKIKEIGFTPKVSLKEGLEKTISWVSENINLNNIK